MPPPIPCPGVPAINSGLAGPLLCGPCEYDPNKLCAFTDPVGLGDTSFFQYPWFPASWSITPYDPSYRGFDDPQADPSPGLVFSGKSVQITYTRADQFDLGGGLGKYFADDTATGNPPWGSQPLVPDNDTDGTIDPSALLDRNNRGAYAAIYDNDAVRTVPFRDALGNPITPPFPPFVYQYAQQSPDDALASNSCAGAPNPCDVYTQDCGGLAKYNTKVPTDPNTGLPYVPYPLSAPLSQPDWPVIPMPRDWIATDQPSVAPIKRLLRFASSIVSYDPAQPHMSEYSLAEDANSVVVTAPGTPIAGVLLDAFNYFKNSVFQETDDPSLDCRNYIIVYITDGLDECFSNACAGGPTTNGPSGDLGQILLPEKSPGSRAAANALDSTIRVKGIPVFVVALGQDPNDPSFKCIATNTGGKVFGATDRASLQAALRNILNFKTNPNFFSSPSQPAFAGGFSDAAEIGAVIPSHVNPFDGSFSNWAIWNGSLKAFRLDSNGHIPVVTAGALAPTNTPTPGGPTPTPAPTCVTPTPTPLSGLTYPDETVPDNASSLTRRPVWNAARVLGYTNPVPTLGEDQAPAPAVPAAKAPEIDVWPGRKLLWTTGAGGPAVPLARHELMPNTGPCTGACFNTLVTAMGLNPLSLADRTTAVNVVNFLRGGVSSFGSRDEVLNLYGTYIGSPPALIGPTTSNVRYSYYYQDIPSAPGDPPQATTDVGAPDGYPHKLGDIFHSDPVVVQPPRYFQYLSANLAPNGKAYSDFAALHQERRKVAYVGANDGFLHAFDSAVFGRDPINFPGAYDLGTGREIFGYMPRHLVPKTPGLLGFPPTAQYFVDGSSGTADVFIDTNFALAPNNLNRDWKTVLVGGLRQGGRFVYALDVTYPDVIDTVPASPTFGQITIAKDNTPGCLDGGGAGCPHPYPQILWELTDDCAIEPLTCALPNYAMMGQTWSRPVVGRIKVLNGASTEDRYVAIFGGGNDPTFAPLDTVLDADQSPCPPSCKKATRGREFYIVDVETGKILYKAVDGVDGSGTPFKFAPMPAAPALVDYNDDGYLDLAYIGDVNGQMWRIDLTPDAAAVPKRGDLVAGLLTGYQPFLLFRTDPASSPQPVQPIYLEAGIIYLAGGLRPTLGVAFGTGNRSELAGKNIYKGKPYVNRFYFVVDSNQTTTATEVNLRNITSAGGVTAAGAGPGPANTGCATAPCTGYFLDFANTLDANCNPTYDEKTTSTVFSTQGYLTLITFTANAGPCSTEGTSFRYRFFFLNGQGGYNLSAPTGTYADYRQSLGKGLASASQGTSPQGDIIDTVVFSGGSVNQQNTASSISTVNVNWKEQ